MSEGEERAREAQAWVGSVKAALGVSSLRSEPIGIRSNES